MSLPSHIKNLIGLEGNIRYAAGVTLSLTFQNIQKYQKRYGTGSKPVPAKAVRPFGRIVRIKYNAS